MAKLLLDTTYLLPVFGINIRLKKFSEKFPVFMKKHSLLYNPISLIEAKWIIIRLSKKMPEKREVFLRRFRKGLKILLNSTMFSQTALTNAEIEEIGDELLIKFKVSGYFDRIIYATAVYYDVVLLTEDERLHIVANMKDAPKLKEVLRWKDLL